MKIPILIYHRLSKDKKKNRYIIHEKDFLSHLEYLSINNYKCILLKDYYKSLLYPLHKIPEKSVIITFDDGHESDYKIVLPNLKKCNFKANFFITTDWIGKTGYMTAKQLKILSDEGMSVQSHAKTHNFLDKMSKNDIDIELQESKEKIESITGQEVSFLSIPGGRLNQTVIRCANELGYKAIFTSTPFRLTMESDLWLIGRIGMRHPLSASSFKNLLDPSQAYVLRKKMAMSGKKLLKYCLGGDIYYQLWKIFIKK